MTRLFLRFYLALGLVVALWVTLLLALPDDAATVDLPERIGALSTAPRLVAERLAVATTPEAREEARVQLSTALSAAVFTAPLAQARDRLSSLERERLERGEAVAAVWVDEAPALLVRVPDQPLVAVIQPAMPTPSLWRIPLLALSMVGGLGLAVLVTLLPLQRQMTALSDSAARFGRGELAVRAALQTRDAAGEVAATFNVMAERVEGLVHDRDRLLRAREELLLAVAHELRTPLARMRFAIELLADSEDAADRERQRQEVEGDIVELEGLVSELLTFASLEDDRRPLQRLPLDLAALARAECAAAARLRPEIQVDCLIEDGVVVNILAEERLVARALRNLLGNAARYTRSTVHLRLEADPAQLRLRVEDDGPGVAEADRARIFEPLVRLDGARSRDAGGVGMGLALARRIARSHGGDLQVQGSELGGACFVLDLPRAGLAGGSPGV